MLSGALSAHQGAKRQREVGDLPCASNMPPPPAGLRVGGLTAAAAFIEGDGGATAAPRSRRRSNLGRRLLFDAAKEDKPLSRCDDPSPCYLLVTPPTSTKAPRRN